MRLLTYLEQDEFRPACLAGGKIVDIPRALDLYLRSKQDNSFSSGVSFSSVRDYFSLTGTEKQALEEAVEFVLNDAKSSRAQEGILHSLESIKLAPPIPQPGKIICAAMNYPSGKHAEKPDFPVIFLKPVSTLTGDNSPIRLAAACQKVLFEAELAFYIIQSCHNIGRADAKECIGGYTIANDIGDSVLEKRSSQWASGKMFDTFTPVGPFLITGDEVPDPHNLTIQTYHNDRLVQEANTGEMLFDIFTLTSYLSTITTLQPGDLILTGSPKQMGGKIPQIDPLQPGDQLKVVINGLGELNNHVVQGE